MNPGDKVKVRIRDDNRSVQDNIIRPDWKIGTFVQYAGKKSCIEVNGEQKLISTLYVKRFQELTEEQAEEATKRDLPIALDMITKAIAALCPGETAVLNGGVVSAYHEAITLEPTIYEAETIGAFIERPGYSVTTWKYIPATYHEPEDVEETWIGNYPNVARAVVEFINTLLKMKASDYWQNSQPDCDEPLDIVT